MTIQATVRDSAMLDEVRDTILSTVEQIGASGVSDLVRTDLVHAPINITATPYVSEHLGWSD